MTPVPFVRRLISAVGMMGHWTDARTLLASFRGGRNPEFYSNAMKRPCVYLLASGRNGTLYVGVTSRLINRLSLHREEVIGGFTQEYGVHRLVWFEEFEDMPTAITREKQIKKWNRAWKLRLIESHNPQWRDLWEEIV